MYKGELYEYANVDGEKIVFRRPPISDNYWPENLVLCICMIFLLNGVVRNLLNAYCM